MLDVALAEPWLAVDYPLDGAYARWWLEAQPAGYRVRLELTGPHARCATSFDGADPLEGYARSMRWLAGQLEGGRALDDELYDALGLAPSHPLVTECGLGPAPLERALARRAATTRVPPSLVGFLEHVADDELVRCYAADDWLAVQKCAPPTQRGPLWSCHGWLWSEETGALPSSALAPSSAGALAACLRTQRDAVAGLLAARRNEGARWSADTGLLLGPVARVLRRAPGRGEAPLGPRSAGFLEE